MITIRIKVDESTADYIASEVLTVSDLSGIKSVRAEVRALSDSAVTAAGDVTISSQVVVSKCFSRVSTYYIPGRGMANFAGVYPFWNATYGYIYLPAFVTTSTYSASSQGGYCTYHIVSPAFTNLSNPFSEFSTRGVYLCSGEQTKVGGLI